MDDTLNKIKSIDSSVGPQVAQFGKYEEEAIISLAIDLPEFFTSVGRFMKPNMFQRLECQVVMAEILNNFEKHNIVPSRNLLKDRILAILTEDDPYESILAIIDRKSNYREVPIIKESLLKWAKDKAFGQIYSEEAQNAYVNGDYEFLESIIQDANRIADVGKKGFWFFDNYQLLFQQDIVDHRTTGFPKLDKILNNGGPSKKEVVCWLAPTNVGKSVVLCNNAISSIAGNSGDSVGQDVLLITYELDAIKTALRCLGVVARDIPIDQLQDHQEYINRVVRQMQETYNKRFLIVEWPPDECSVANIYALLDSLRRTDNWKPDVVVVDYLDLMVSRNPEYNKDDYTRQKHVANELRGLAINEDVLIFTATQTNRTAAGGGEEELADLSKASESFAKQFSLDYVVSLNQSRSERSAVPPRMRMFVTKNRNGPKNVIVQCSVTYETMLVREL